MQAAIIAGTIPARFSLVFKRILQWPLRPGFDQALPGTAPRATMRKAERRSLGQSLKSLEQTIA
jgi:hypothetical protein